MRCAHTELGHIRCSTSTPPTPSRLADSGTPRLHEQPNARLDPTEHRSASTALNPATQVKPQECIHTTTLILLEENNGATLIFGLNNILKTAAPQSPRAALYKGARQTRLQQSLTGATSTTPTHPTSFLLCSCSLGSHGASLEPVAAARAGGCGGDVGGGGQGAGGRGRERDAGRAPRAAGAAGGARERPRQDAADGVSTFTHAATVPTHPLVFSSSCFRPV